MTQSLIIIGDSSFAEVACELFSAGDRYDVLAFAVDRQYLKRDSLLDRPVIALEEITKRFPPESHSTFVALTYRELNRARARLVGRMRILGYRLASYISPDAHVWPNVQVGENTFVFESNVVQPFVRIGNNVVLWSGNHVGHHSIIDDNVFVASHVVISGHVSIGQNSFLGVNATIADQVKIAEDNWIGPNVLITKDTEKGQMFRAESTPVSKVNAYRFFRIPSDDHKA